MKVVIAALRYSPAHIQHMMAYEKLLLKLGYDVTYLLTKEYNDCAEFALRDNVVNELGNLNINEYKAIIIQCAALDNIFVVRRWKKFKKKIIYIFHEPDLSLHRLKKESFLGALKLLIAGVCSYLVCRGSNYVVVASDYALKQYQNMFVKANKNVIKIPLLFSDDIDDNQIQVENKRYFSYIGTACVAHAFSKYLELIKIMHKKNIQIKFLIATKTNITKYLDDELLHMRDKGIVEIYHGKVMSNEDINKYYLESFCVWNAYSVSTQSGVLGKAFMAGTPVIATDTGAFKECVSEGVDGEFIELNEIKDMISKVMLIKNNIVQYANNARLKYIKLYSYNTHINLFSKIINDEHE